MRYVIQSARVPFTPDMWDSLRELHQRFEEAFHKRLAPPATQKIASQARKLSGIYNLLSPEAPYGRPELAEARLFFFMPTDIPKVWGPAGEVLASLDLETRKRLSILDLGAGTGTAAVGLVLLLAAAGYKGRVQLTLTEPDPEVARYLRVSMEALRDLDLLPFDYRVDSQNLETWLAGHPGERFDLVVELDVLCEAFAEDAYVDGMLNLARRLLKERVKRTGFLFLIEPALKRFARRVTEVAARYHEAGGIVFAPCACGVCSNLSRKGAFCFQSIRVPQSPLVQSVAARSRLERHEVNYSYLTFSPRQERQPMPADGPATGRIVSFPRRVKKGFTYFVCTPRGLINAFAPRFLEDGETRGGRLPHGTLVTLTGGPDA